MSLRLNPRIADESQGLLLRDLEMSEHKPEEATNTGVVSNRSTPVRVAAWLGISLNLILVIVFPLLAARVVPPAQSALSSTAASLRSLATSFDHVSTTLVTSTTVLESSSVALEQASSSIEKSTAVIDSASGIVNDIGSGLITGSQGALNRVETAAGAIDQALNLLSSLGLLGQDPGQVEDTLGDSIQKLNQVLEVWPGEFTILSGSLDEISRDIEGVTASLDEIRADLDDFLEELGQLIDQLETLSKDFKQTADQLDLWAGRVPLISWLFFGTLSLLLLINAWSQLLNIWNRNPVETPETQAR